MIRIRHVIILVMAVCTAHCHAQVTVVVAPDIVEAITRVVKAGDCQETDQILGEDAYQDE